MNVLKRTPLVSFLVFGAASACSSDITFQPVDSLDAGMMTQPALPGGGSGGMPPVGIAGSGGAAGSVGEPARPLMMEPAGGTGGAMVGAGGSEVAPPACPDSDADGVCDVDDPCPNVANEAPGDRDGDGTLDACDRCPDVPNQDDAADVDGDGIPDACDTCGIGVALDLEPMFYFPLDDGAFAGDAVNLGRVPQSATYTGPVTRNLRGVADPEGRAVRMAGSQGGQFSRITLLNALEFPSDAMTVMFWVRTSQTTDFTIFSYALQGSQNEFGMIFEPAAIRVTFLSSEFSSVGIDPFSIADGAWHHVVFTWQGAEGRFYFDGQPAGSPIATVAGNEVIAPGASPVTGPLAIRPGGVLVLGQDQDTLNGGFNAAQALTGGLDEVAIFDRVLTPEEIRTVFEATTCGERCDGIDNDGDGSTDEGFIGTAPECAAASCQAISDAGHAFGTGTYFVTSAPGVPTTCAF